MTHKIKDALNSRIRNTLPSTGLVSAAILIPLLHKDNKLHILFTKRSRWVEHHKSEISFPGGTLDRTDENHLNCVLRECEEEIGLKKNDIEVLGLLDDFKTVVTHFVITPFVGLIPYPYNFKICEREIEEIIIIPISFLTDPSNYRMDVKIISDKVNYRIHSYYYKEHTIWGATGYILKQFLELFLEIR
ncbi:MAG: CoA pyrophosphatase [Spirochaetota bacterium]|nr:CoA pyrophosphatase [Spirochaetota bacterium]